MILTVIFLIGIFLMAAYSPQIINGIVNRNNVDSSAIFIWAIGVTMIASYFIL